MEIKLLSGLLEGFVILGCGQSKNPEIRIPDFERKSALRAHFCKVIVKSKDLARCARRVSAFTVTALTNLPGHITCAAFVVPEVVV